MQIVIDIPDGMYKAICDSQELTHVTHIAIKEGTPLPKGHRRKFEEIVVEYLPAELCIYPEYRGKPYFSIMYEENGKHIIGFGTYNPDVLSRYLQEYFIAPTIIEADKESK